MESISIFTNWNPKRVAEETLEIGLKTNIKMQ